MKYLFACILTGICVFFVSCASPVPSFDDVRIRVLYDVQDKTNPMRLAVYVRLDSDEKSGGSLTLSLPAARYTWNIERPSYVYDVDSASMWIGSSDIVPASMQSFPSGQYHLVYTDAAGMKAETDFTLPVLKDAQHLDLSMYTSGRLAVFNAAGLLLGYNIDAENSAPEEIPEKYPGAAFTRMVLLCDDGLTAVLQPPVVIPGETDIFLRGAGQ